MSKINWGEEAKKYTKKVNWSKEAERMKNSRTADTSMVDQNYIDSFFKDADNYFKSAESDYGKIGWGESVNANSFGLANDLYNSKSNAWNDLSSRADAVGAWLYKNRNFLSPDAYTYYNEYLDSFYEGGKGILDSFKDTMEAYNNTWENQDEYAKWYQGGYYGLRDIAKSDVDFLKYADLGKQERNAVNNAQQYETFHKILERLGLYSNYHTMTDDEVNIYNYFVGKGEIENAEKYLSKLSEYKLKPETGKRMANAVSGDKGLELIFAAVAGLNQFEYGLKNFDNLSQGLQAEETPTIQYAIPHVRENMTGGWGIAYDLAQTTANMLPSIMVGALDPAAGTLTMGASSAGNAYAQMRNLGYNEDQSRAYGLLVGVSETTLQYFLGGISKLGGKVSNHAIKNLVSKVDDVVAKAAISLGGKMASEGTEEAIQTMLEPAIKALVTGEEFESPEWEDVLYSGLLGALSAGTLEGAPTIAPAISSNIRLNKEISALKKNPEALKTMLETIAMENPDVDVSKLLNKINEGKNISNGKLKKALVANERSIWNKDYNSLVDATESRLTELGERGDVKKLAESIVKAQYGYDFNSAVDSSIEAITQNKELGLKDLSYLMAEYSQNAQNKQSLSKAEQKAIRDGEYGRRVSNELNPNMREETSSAWAQGVKTNRLGNTAENVAKTRAALTQLNEASKSQKKLPSNAISYKSGAVDATLTQKGRDAKIEGENKSVSETYARAEGYKGLANETFSKYYKGENIEEYALGFREAYDYGLNGTVKDVKDLSNHGSFKSYINEEAREMAFNAGVVDAKYMGIKSKTIKVDGDYKVTVPMSNKALSESKQATIELMKVLAPIAKVNMSTMVSLKDHGLYDPKTNTIYIDLAMDGRDVMIFTLSHELTHHLKRVNPEQFDEFARALFEEVGKTENVEERIAKWMRENKKYYPNMAQAEFKALAREEVVAEMCESFLTDEKVVQRISQKVYESDKGLWNTIKKWFEDLVAKLKKLFADLDPQSENGRIVREMGDRLDAVKQMWADMIVESGKVEKVASNTNPMHSFKGIKAQNNDITAFNRAQEMARKGIDSETIRKETGWFVSYDGKWRFEIDDSAAVWHLDTAKPDSKRLFELSEKVFKLSDLLEHPTLYEAYPQLKEVTVWENPNSKTEGYVVGRSTDSITVRSLKDTNINKDFLIHEIQHLIQNIEGFSSGASIDQFSYKSWGEKEYKAYDKRNDIASKIYPTLRRHGVSITKADIEAVRSAFDTTDSIIDYNYLLLGSIADNNPKIDKLFDEYLEQVQILNLTTPSGQYHAVAGEVEAYDTQARRRMTAEERKNTRPNIDRKDVIFAKNGIESYVIKRDGKGREYWEIDSGKDIFKGLATPEEYRDAAYSFLISNRDNKVILKDKSGKEIVFIRLSAEEFTQSIESQDLYDSNPTMFAQKMRLVPSLDDILLHYNVNWRSPDHKNHKLFKEKGFENYRGRVRIDNVIFNTVVRVGKAKFGGVFYDINLEVDSYLPHASNGASDINESTSTDNSIAQNSDLSTVSSKNINGNLKRSRKDSDGNTLTEAQAEYFKDSKVRDENGNLYVVYHGSASKFTEFKHSKIGAHGTSLGRGFYFTEDVSLASSYHKDEGQLLKGYLDIKKPLIDGEKTIKKVEVTKLIKAICEAEAKYLVEDGGYDSIDEAIKDTFISNYVNTYNTSMANAYREMAEQVYRYNDSDADIIGELINGGAGASRVLGEVRKMLGYDGVMFKHPDGTHEFVAFESNQFKNIDNLNPTINPDIRYSRKTVDAITSREELAKALSKVAKGEDRAIVETYKSNVNLIKGETERLESLRKEIDEIKYKKSITYEGRELSVKEFEQIAYTKAYDMGIDAERVKFKALKESGKYIATADGKKILEAEKRFRTKDDIDKLATLEHNYQATIKRITTYDKKLLQIEAMSSIKQLINREKKASYDKAKAEGKEALKEYKAQAIAEQKKITERYQEMRKKNVEGRKTTEMRHKLMNTVHTLDQLLVNPTKKKHIPIGLQKPVAEALNILNTDTVGAEERLAKITSELKTTDDPVEIERLLERYNRIKAQGDKIKEKIDSLKAAYDKLLTSEDEIIRNSHDEVISNMIQNASEKIGDKAVRDMTYDELEMLYKMYRAILKTVRDANTSFKMAKGEEISTLGQSVMGELAGFERKNKEQIKLIADIKDGAEWYQWNNLKPIYAFKRIGSSTLETLYNNVREGEDVWAVDMSEARVFSDAEKTKFGYSKWDMDKSYTFRTRSGKDFKLTLGQIMSIYAYTKRGEQAINHLVEGGFVYDGTTEIKKNVKGNVEITYELKDSTAYRLSEEIIGQINATLTPAQKSFVDSMQNYLSTVMGEKGNKVSLALYDIKLFGEKNYFPLKSSQVFLERAREQARGEVKVKNKGFTKETTPKANNPIVLESFMDVWANHCVEMGMYHAFTLPLEDFYRVYNYKERATDEKDSESVIMHLENAFGNSATKYIDQLLVDINGGTRADPRINFSSRWIAKFKKAKTFLSASVVIQQPSAVARAMALIDGKYFIEKPTNHKATWNEIKKYAPVAIIKEMGYFDTGMGLSSKDWLKNEPTKMEKVEEALSKAPAYADEIGWNIIWRAVKREIADTTNLKVNSEEFLKRCGERFTEVITMTQVYDSVFARSSLMRSKDGLAKMLTAFMAEPTTTINMLAYGLNQRVRGNKGVMSHFAGACLTSVILNSMLVSIVYAARDDDEDEEYWEKYLGALGKQTIDSVNIFKMMPFIKDMVSIFEGFTVSRTDVSLITDIYWAWQKLDNDNVSAYKKVEDFAGSIAAIFGVPLKNLMRDLRALWNLITSSMK